MDVKKYNVSPRWSEYEYVEVQDIDFDHEKDEAYCPKCASVLFVDWSACPGYQRDGVWMSCWQCGNAWAYECEHCGWLGFTLT